jgi:hypothetical protein
MVKKKEMVIKSSGKRVLANVKQKDMFPARKKLAEQANKAQVMGKVSIEEKVMELTKGFDYLRGYTKADSGRLDLIVAQMNDKFTKLDNEVADIRSNVQRLAHAVELLNKRSVKTKPAVKAWAPEEYIRLDSEYDLMLRCDGEADLEVLREIHDCTMAELVEAIAHVRKPDYEA